MLKGFNKAFACVRQSHGACRSSAQVTNRRIQDEHHAILPWQILLQAWIDQSTVAIGTKDDKVLFLDASTLRVRKVVLLPLSVRQPDDNPHEIVVSEQLSAASSGGERDRALHRGPPHPP